MEVEVEVGGDVDFGVGGGRRTIRMVGGEWKTAWKMMSKSSWGRRWRWVWRVVVVLVLGSVMIPFFFLFSFADVGSLGWWEFLFLHLLLHDRFIIHGYSKKLEMRRW